MSTAKKPSRKPPKAHAGYGLALMMVFLLSTMLSMACWQLFSKNSGIKTFAANRDYIMAEQIARSAVHLARADIVTKLTNGITVDTSYSFTSTMTVPSDPTNLASSTVTVGSYTATLPRQRGDSYLIKIEATVGTAKATTTQYFNLQAEPSSKNGVMVFLGRNAADSAGYSVSSAGDVNGDGMDDLLIGAPYGDGGGTDSGETYLILGRSKATWQSLIDASGNFNLDIMSDANTTVRFIGRNASDNAGFSASSAGDVNGDGMDDLLIGAPYADGGGTDSGETYLILGRSTANWQALTDANGDFNLDNMSDANNTVRFLGRNASDNAGYSVSSAGDVDNDGYADLLIGALYADGGGTDSGETYLILGRSTVTWQTLTDASGNFNLDNLTEANGMVRFLGRNAGDISGWSVSSAGDVNNDGYDDILTSAIAAGAGGVQSGDVNLILGRSTANWQALTPASGDFNLDNMSDANNTVRFLGRNAYEYFDYLGYSVSSVGDVNNDGYDDILLGSIADGGGLQSGEVYLILGRSTANWQSLTDVNGDFNMNNLSEANGMVRFIGRNAGDQATFVSNAGDVNNDGYADLLIGGWTADGGGADSGEAYLILGRSTANWQALTPASGDFNLDNMSDANNTVRFIGRNAGDEAYWDYNSFVSSAGDVNGDGIADLLIGAPYADGGGTDSGEAYLILGRSTANWQALTDVNGDFNLDNLNGF